MSIRTAVIQKIKKKWDVVCSHLTEKASRLWAASEALSLEKFGITDVAKATGISRTTIYQGLEEIKNGTDPSYIRKKGAGRKRIAKKNSKIYKDLENILEVSTLGDPESAAQYTSASVENITQQLRGKEHKISTRSVNRLLHELEYSLQANKKTKEGEDHPDRNAQFEYISNKIKDFQSRGFPVISVDAKKKELIGNYKNNGKEWRKKKESPQSKHT